MNQLSRIFKPIIPPIIWSLCRQIYLVCRQIYLNIRYGQTAEEEQRRKLEASYRELNKGLGTATMVFRPGLKFDIHPESRDSFEHFCYQSPVMVDEMNCFLEAIKDKKKLLDIGALHGVFSLVFALQGPDRKVLSVDASPLAFSRLLYNVYKNSLNNIATVECAMSDKAGTLAMHYEWEHLVAACADSADNYVDVEMTTGDSLCASRDFDPDVIKIDVEGHEIKVIKGLSEIIKRSSPLIFLEVHPGRIAEEGDDIAFIDEFFGALGYVACQVSGAEFPLSLLSNLSNDERLVLRHKAKNS